MAFDPQNLVQRANAAGKAVEDFVQENTNINLDIPTVPNIDPNAIADSVIGKVEDFVGATINQAVGAATQYVEQAASAAGLLGLLGLGGALPKDNELKDFASYNYVFTLGCLTNFEINFPDFTYRRRDPSVLILRSGGGLGNSKATTAYELTGRTEYYIEDVSIDSLVGINGLTKQSNATNIEFKVVEPYSMGMFLQTLQVAALRARHPNYLQAPFVLSVEFKGWDDRGNLISKPNLRRIFPLKFSNIDFQVTEGGSEYNITAYPWNESALTDKVQTVQADVNLSGSTVSSLLQTGGKSLASWLNEREIQRKEDGQVEVPNEYVILFPKSRASLDQPLTSSDGSQQGATTDPSLNNGESVERELTEEEKLEIYESITGIEDATLPQDFDADLSKLLGVIVQRSNIGESVREFAENPENINEIGNAKLVESYLDGGQKPFGRPRFVEETEPVEAPPTVQGTVGTGVFKRGNITISDNGRVITFKNGAKIQDIIEEIILLSEYGRSIAEAEPDENGMIPYFRIETNVYQITNYEQANITGEFPKLFVYRILPYKAHISRISQPTNASPGIENLQRQCVKQYDYIYTGKNDDILDFNIQFDAAFFTAISPFAGRNSIGTATEAEESAGPPPGHPEYNQAAGNNVISSSGNSTTGESSRSESGQSGGGITTNRVQIARDFNDALVNSPVDLVSVDLKIWGDPYYITDSGMGNYSAAQSLFINLTSDGTMDYQSSEVDIKLNFRTPLDYKVNGSYMDFPGLGSQPVGAFSGVYQVMSCRNNFSQGVFSQELKLIRRRNQPGADTNAEAVDVGNAVVQEAVQETGSTTTGGTSEGGSGTGNAGSGNGSGQTGGTGATASGAQGDGLRG